MRLAYPFCTTGTDFISRSRFFCFYTCHLGGIMEEEVVAYAPASVSNVACGFDIMGFALDRPGDKVTVRFTRGRDVTIRSITGCTSALPFDATKHTAGAPVIEMLKHCGIRQGVEIEIRKGLPAGTGIGSSAASAVAAAVACDA